MDDIEDECISAVCCPTVPRMDGIRTVAGQDVFDAHVHKGMVRGSFHLAPGVKKTLCWLRNGRLTPARETEWDLRRTRG